MLGSLFGARTLIENQAFQAARITDIYPHRGEKSEGKKSRAAPSTANPVAVLQRAVRSFFSPPSRRVYFAPSFPDHASSMKNNDAFLPDIFVEGTTPTRNFVPFWKMNKFLFFEGGDRRCL